MEWSHRTIVRVFLVVGGIAFLVVGALDQSIFELALGALAVVLGAVGLWMERSGRFQGPGPDDFEE